MGQGDKLNWFFEDYIHVNCRKVYIQVWYIAEVAKKKNQSDAENRKIHKHHLIFKQSVSFGE